MQDILTITLNPALDMSSSVGHVVAGEKLRCAAPVYDPGGGGINVARAIVLLGGTAQAFVAVAGFRGAQLVDLLEAEGVSVVPHQVEGETRLSLAVVDRADGRQYRFVMPGPDWSTKLVARALEAIGEVLSIGEYLVLSGSQPPGVPDDFPARLANLAGAHTTKLVLDTSGGPLHALLDGPKLPLHVLRLDGSESEELAGHRLRGTGEVAQFAASLVARGVAGMVVLALGARGSVLANANGCWHAATPPVPVLSKVGAGDSFVGAFTLALSRGAPPEDALCHGVAAASAAVMSNATALCRKADYLALYKQVTLSRL